MKNLAGDPRCDDAIREELETAKIEEVVVEAPAMREVPARISGKLGQFTFERAWYYWTVSGPMPIALASEMYATPIGKQDVRAGGHAGRPDPTKYGADGGYVPSYHVDSLAGLILIADTIRKIEVHK